MSNSERTSSTRYRVIVYRRTGVLMQTFNADNIDQAMTIRHKNAGLRGVYKIELLAAIDSWTFEETPTH